MTSKQMLKEYTDMLFNEAMEKKKNGGLICWSSSVVPGELFDAMDISVIYPENHAAIIGAKHYSDVLIEHAENIGYDNGICSYAKINLAYTDYILNRDKYKTEIENCPAPEIPLPDIIVVCNNICSLLIKWYENLAVTLNVPFVLIDVPFIHDGEISKKEVGYILSQFENIKREIETIAGRKYNEEKLKEEMEQRKRSSIAWEKVMKLSEEKPSALNGFDLFNFMSLAVCASYRKCAEDTFNTLYEELKRAEETNENGMRVFWEGIACWPYLSFTYKTLKNCGFKVSASMYPDMWNVQYSTMEEMAAAFANIYTNRSLDEKIKLISSMGEKSHCDAYVYHQNRSCKLMSFLLNETAEGVKSVTGKPYIIFDGDQTDPGNFSQGQFETKVQALSEMAENY